MSVQRVIATTDILAKIAGYATMTDISRLNFCLVSPRFYTVWLTRLAPYKTSEVITILLTRLFICCSPRFITSVTRCSNVCWTELTKRTKQFLTCSSYSLAEKRAFFQTLTLPQNIGLLPIELIFKAGMPIFDPRFANDFTEFTVKSNELEKWAPILKTVLISMIDYPEYPLENLVSLLKCYTKLGLPAGVDAPDVINIIIEKKKNNAYRHLENLIPYVQKKDIKQIRMHFSGLCSLTTSAKLAYLDLCGRHLTTLQYFNLAGHWMSSTDILIEKYVRVGVTKPGFIEKALVNGHMLLIDKLVIYGVLDIRSPTKHIVRPWGQASPEIRCTILALAGIRHHEDIINFVSVHMKEINLLEHFEILKWAILMGPNVHIFDWFLKHPTVNDIDALRQVKARLQHWSTKAKFKLSEAPGYLQEVYDRVCAKIAKHMSTEPVLKRGRVDNAN